MVKTNFVDNLLKVNFSRTLFFCCKGIESLTQTQTLNPCILANQWFRPLILKTMDAIRLSNLSKKYPRLTLSDCKDLVCGKNSIPLSNFPS